MPFRKVQSEKLSTAVVRQVELLILRGILRPGERLPSERDLSEQLGVSRPSLREAISTLQEHGLLSARAGSGIYVAEVLGSAFSPALVRLFATHEEAVVDYLAFRRDMEGQAAEYAAQRASDADLKVIDTIYNRMEKASGADTDADLDADFHVAIIEASHNVVMLHMMRSMYDLLREGVFYNRQMMFAQNISRKKLLTQHRAINMALQSRDPAGARKAVETHLDYVATAYRDLRKADLHDEIARQRLAHEKTRR